MIASTRITSALDRQRLLDATDNALTSWATYAPYLEYFRQELRWAQSIPAQHVPHDMVTLDSRVELLDPATGQLTCCTLTLPQSTVSPAQSGSDVVSVLSPMGVALCGARVGELISWPDGESVQSALIHRLIHQPESAQGSA
ncbi:MAG: GreA/GreB family elongation factor [Phycisphaerales bacterium]|nr:GreA/GreB family elongation factor [Phycisphaerales bacterium]